MIEAKVLEKLEFNKIQTMIADLAFSEEGRERGAALKPISDFDFVNQRWMRPGRLWRLCVLGKYPF